MVDRFTDFLHAFGSAEFLMNLALGKVLSCRVNSDDVAPRVSGRSAEDVKIMVKAFLAERGVQANSKAWHNAVQSEHIQRMAIAHAQRPK